MNLRGSRIRLAAVDFLSRLPRAGPRAGVLTLRYYDQEPMAFSSLRDLRERLEHSLRSRICPEISRRRVRWTQGKDVFLELVAETLLLVEQGC
jgi:hypothetical protein